MARHLRSTSTLNTRFRRRPGALALVFSLLLPGLSLGRQFDLVGPSGSEAFGTQVVALPNGNIVVTDPYWDAPGPVVDAGAVYLYAPDGTLISTLTGSSANDLVGYGSEGNNSITVLANGHFVVSSPYWNDGASSAVGAATWIDGSSGLNGSVSASNSLVGSSANDRVGEVVTALANGHYVVSEISWDNGAALDAGAVTWANGEGGTIGAVSASNSLVGSSSNDRVGGSSIEALANGDYVVTSLYWDNAGVVDAGAVTWGNGDGGTVGTVSASNSLVGSSTGNEVGSGGIVELSQGHYVVGSPSWDDAGASNVGAATWCNADGSTVGAVSASNSLVGSSANDLVATGRIVALSNGNYVVKSRNWNGSAGAATWGDGSSGVVGVVSSSNSLVGSTAGDQVGEDVIALSNGHYVVLSSNWDNGAVANVGAVTWGDGASGISGAVSSSNSLVGSTAGDRIGYNASDKDSVIALGGGHYVVGSPFWDDGSTVNAGAATWADGSSGSSGTISSANSLVGSSADDQVGRRVVALTNGHYVVASFQWDNGGTANVGAVTWGDGASGITGSISSGNSLIGGSTEDSLGVVLVALSNGNYVAGSQGIDIGGNADAGALAWADGSTGLQGVIGTDNAQYGIDAGDQFGYEDYVFALSNGNYVSLCADCSVAGVDGVGRLTWGNGAIGSTGPVDTASQVHGFAQTDLSANTEDVTLLSDGNYVLRLAYFEGLTGLNVPGAITLGLGDGSAQGVVSRLNSVLGGQDNSGDSLIFDYDPSRQQLLVGRPNESIVTLFLTPVGVTMNVAAGAVDIADDGVCSLREAIHNANADAQVDNDDCPAGDGPDKLVVEGDYLLSDPDADNDANGLPTISSQITIESKVPGERGRILRDTTPGCDVDGTHDLGEFRLILVTTGGDLSLNEIAVSGGCADGGGAFNDGGAIKVEGNGRLMLNASRIENSRARDKSGGIDIGNQAVVTLIDSTVANNYGRGGAGGIGHGSGGLLTVERSLIDNNYAEAAGGGGIGSFPGTMARILNSTIARNYAASGPGGGGGIGNQGTIEIINSTFASNFSDGDLGGSSIGNSGGVVALKNSLIVLEAAQANTFDCANLNAGSYLVEGVVLTNGTAGCSAANAAITSVSTSALGANKASSNTPPTDIGGIAEGYPISPTSLALDAASDCTDFDGHPVTEDQRGIERPDGDTNIVCDVGAFEFSADDAIAQSISFGNNPGPLTFGGSGASVSATASSGLAVNFDTTTPSVCSVNSSSGALTVFGAGSCIVTANQLGNFYYQTAVQAAQTVVIDPASQTVSFGINPGPLTLGGSGGSVSATASSGLTVSYGSTTPSVCSVHSSSGAITMLAAGDCIVTANQAGNGNYLAAPQATQTVLINPPANTPPTINAAASVSLLEDESATLSITLGDAESAAEDLQLSVSASNQTLFTDASLASALSGSAANRSLLLAPTADAFGTATVALTVTDESGVSSSTDVVVTVSSVNDAPSASYLGDRAHVSGSAGAQSIPGFAFGLSAGPANESAQLLQFELQVIADSAAVLSGTPTLGTDGQLNYVLSGNDGVAMLRVSVLDNGGTANGGSDRGSAVDFRIMVGSGALLMLEIERMMPSGKHAAKGATAIEYRITARNDGDVPLAAVRLRNAGSAALSDILWNCLVPSACQPAAGSGALDTQFDLAAGASVIIELSANLDNSQPFAELGVNAEVSSGAMLLPGSQTRVVQVSPANANGVFRSSFE